MRDGGETPALPVLRFDSTLVPREEQFAAYATFHSRYEVSVPDPAAGFVARAEAWLLGPMILSLTSLDPVAFTRSERLIRADGSDHYSILLMQEGSCRGDFAGRFATVSPGEALVIDLARPMSAQGDRSRSVVLLVPRPMLHESLPPFDLHGLVLRGGAGGIFCDHLASLSRRVPGLRPEEAEPLVRATRDLLVGCLGALRPPRIAPAASESVLARAKRYIEAHLQRPLSIDEICAVLGTSRTSVYRAFEPEGGVTAYIHRLRLARVHAALSRRDEHRSVSEIAYAHGFLSSAHFSRLFKKEYGYTATAFRAASHRPKPASERPAKEDAEAYDRWRARLR